MKTMNIMVILNTNYYKYFLVLMTSIFHNHKDMSITYYVVFNELDENAQNELQTYASANNSRCVFIERSNDVFEGLKVAKSYPRELYWKLVPHYVIPDDIDRVLFLDIDMIVDGSLEEVYNIDFPEGCCFFACRGIYPFKRYYLMNERGTVACNSVNSGGCEKKDFKIRHFTTPYFFLKM